MKKLVPLGALLVIAALAIAAGPALLGPRPDAASHEEHVDSTRGTVVGLAPAPVVNPPASAAKLVLTTQPSAKAELGYVLEVRVTQPDGKPAADLPVKFYELVELFGQREMLIAAATTDGRGIASYTYLPARTGAHPLVARSAGRDRSLTAGEARLTFEASVAAPPYESTRSKLSRFSDRVPYAAGLVVLGVWGLIAFALFGTARGVIGGARETPRKGDTA